MRKQYLDAMGIQTWYSRFAEVQAVVENAMADVSSADESTKPAESPAISVSIIESKSEHRDVTERLPSPSLESINQSIQDCAACALHETRKAAIPGEGNPDASLLLVVSSPARINGQEHLLSRDARSMLDAMLKAIGESLSSVYLTSLVKCCPPERKPQTSEIICCDEHLVRQIKQIRPSAIMLLGEDVSQQLLVSQKNLIDLRLRQHQHEGVPVFASYHPQDVHGNADNKRKSWQDLLQIKKCLADASRQE